MSTTTGSGNSLAERIRQVVAESGMDGKAFAEVAAIPYPSLRDYMRGTQPGADALRKICVASGASADWLLTGEGPEYARRSPRRVDEPAGLTREADDFGQMLESHDGRQYVLLPSFDVKVSAGGGSVVHSEQVVDSYAFTKRWWDENVGIPPARALLFEAHGDSMVPDVLDGELVIIDTGKNAFVGDAIYAILLGGELRLKKVHQRIDGSVEIRSSNEAHSTEVLTGEEAAELVVIGRGRRVLSDRRLP